MFYGGEAFRPLLFVSIVSWSTGRRFRVLFEGGIRAVSPPIIVFPILCRPIPIPDSSFGLPPPTDLFFLQYLAVIKFATAWGMSEVQTVVVKLMSDRAHYADEDDWAYVLDVCTDCNDLKELSELRELAIKICGDWKPVTQIEDGRRYRVKEWVIKGYRKLVAAPDLPTDDDFKVLGIGAVKTLMFLREKLLYQNRSAVFEIDSLELEKLLTQRGELAGLR